MSCGFFDFQHSSQWTRNKTWIVFGAVMFFFVLVPLIGGYFISHAFCSPSALQRNHQKTSWFDAVCSNEISCPSGFERSPLILLSLDGFAARYLSRNLTPSLKRLANCGSRPPFMSPVFPSKTFGNHYSIATGMYPSAHGIVDNTMYDPVFNKTFAISSPESRNISWWGGEPIWLTANGQGLKTASYFWPGTDVVGMHPDYYKMYQKNASFSDRVRQVLRWLDLPADTRPDFITMYLEEPDSSGHMYGPDSKQTDAALQVVDDIIAELMQGLQDRNLIGCINLVIVSDHGMAEISCNRVVYLDEMVPNFTMDDAFFVEGTVGRLRPLNASAATGNELLRLKNAFQCKSPHVWVYDAQDFPVRWEFSGNRRIDPLLFDVDDEWLIRPNYQKSHKYCRGGGDHGYDINEDMLGIFIASGPAFKINYTAEPFLNVQVYNLLSEILGVEPAPNNGTDGALIDMLRTKLPLKYVPKLERGIEICRSATVSSSWKGRCLATASAHIENFTTIGEASLVQGIALGLPQVENGPLTQSCILPNKDYITGFNHMTKSPLWSMFTFDTKRVLHKAYVENSTEIVWVNDPRLTGLENSPNCFRYQTELFRNDNILQVSLLPAFLDDVHLITNAVPMYDGFYSGVWRIIWAKVLLWAKKFHSLNAIVGPVSLQRNSTTEIPTHYFIILTYLIKDDRTTKSLDTMGFILPHLKSIPQCWNIDRYLQKHQSSIEVIASKTGLEFFTDLPATESLRLRLKLVRPVSSSSLFQGELP